MIEVNIGTIVVDPAAIREFLRDPNGPVARDLMARGQRVQTGARGFVRKRTRHLERSIVTRLDITDTGPRVTVGSDADHALIEHEGSRPHIIRPRHKKALRFPARGSTGGNFRMVFALEVRHPGTTGTRYLVRALPLARD